MDTTNYHLQTVTLNVTHLSKMSRFYQDIMGLDILTQSADTVTLGIKIDDVALVILQDVSTAPRQTSGLYHVAYLLPNRRALGNFLRHLAMTQYPLQGASDHGYSEALYLTDPEGNGIEVYADRPQEQWTLKDDGIIVGVTEPMDVAGVLASADGPFEKMVSGSFIGHVHLAVSTIPATNFFFQDILGFTITTQFGEQAAFYGKDGYHHQFAGNSWQSQGLPLNDDGEPGLSEIQVGVSQSVFEQTLKQLQTHEMVFDKKEKEVIFHDPNGIKFRYTLIG